MNRSSGGNRFQAEFVHRHDHGTRLLDFLYRFPGFNGIYMDSGTDCWTVGREIFRVAAEPGNDCRTLTGFDFHTEGTDGVPGHVNHFDARNDLCIRFYFGEINIFYKIVVVAVIQRVGGFAESNFCLVRIERRIAKECIVAAVVVVVVGFSAVA